MMRIVMPVSIPRACRMASLPLKAVIKHANGREMPGISSATE